MQRIGAVVGCQRAGLALQRKFGAADAVAVTPHETTEVGTVGDVAVEIVITEHAVVEFAVLVRRLERLDDAAIGHDARFHSLAVAQSVNFDRCAVRHFAEGSLADGSDCVGWYWHSGAAYKIGRASCRERGEISVVAG